MRYDILCTDCRCLLQLKVIKIYLHIIVNRKSEKTFDCQRCRVFSNSRQAFNISEPTSSVIKEDWADKCSSTRARWFVNFHCIILRTRLCSPSATNMQVSYLLTISREIIYVVKPTDSACSVFIRVCTPTYRHVITFSVEAFFYSANISRFHSILIYFSIIVVVVYCDFLYIHTYIFTCLYTFSYIYFYRLIRW